MLCLISCATTAACLLPCTKSRCWAGARGRTCPCSDGALAAFRRLMAVATRERAGPPLSDASAVPRRAMRSCGATRQAEGEPAPCRAAHHRAI